MTALVNLLPARWRSRAKAIATGVGVVLAVVVALVPVLPKWAIVPVAVLTTVLAHQTPAPGYVPPGDQPRPTAPPASPLLPAVGP